MKEKVKLIEFKDEIGPIVALSNTILDSLNTFFGKGLLITDRGSGADYFKIFTDSLYTYEPGVILLERFFKEMKCKPEGTKYKVLNEDDKILMNEFSEFAKSLPDVELSSDKRNEYDKKLNDYQTRVSNIIPEVNVLNVYKYNNTTLTKFDLIDKDTLDIISKMYADFGISMLSTLTWSSLKGLSYGITSIQYTDYIDLILIPIRQKDED